MLDVREGLAKPFGYYVTGMQVERADAYRERQERLTFNPIYNLAEDLRRFRDDKDVQLGFPEDIAHLFEGLASENVYVILGAALGDEGKGSVVDRLMYYFKDKGLQKVYVTRFQGGSNAGHTVSDGVDTVKLHQIASIPFQPEDVELVGILDSGTLLNFDELKLEYEHIENVVGKDSMKDRLIVSEDAILNTDIDRAEEFLLDFKFRGGIKSPSTFRGMRTASAHYADRTGLLAHDLLADNWEESVGRKYDQMEIDFRARDLDLADTDVPDYEKILVVNQLRDEFEQQKETMTDAKIDIREAELAAESITHKVGTKADFLKRLRDARDWLITKDIVKNTITAQLQSLDEVRQGKAAHIFEGAQAIGLHPTLGTIGKRDTTSTNTDPEGVLYATKVWKIGDKNFKLGVFKATYMSSVGQRIMPTQIDLSKKTHGKEIRRVKDLSQTATPDQKWAAWIREEAHEFGTTTGRPRDICHLDLPFLAYNCYAGKINMLSATHLDIARRGEKIKVCTHYTVNGHIVPYTPGIDSKPGVEAQYAEFDGWNKDEVRKAHSFSELPDEAKAFLSFIQARVGIPIVFSTTGPAREHQVRIPELPNMKKGAIEKVYERLERHKVQIFPN